MFLRSSGHHRGSFRNGERNFAGVSGFRSHPRPPESPKPSRVSGVGCNVLQAASSKKKWNEDGQRWDFLDFIFWAMRRLNTDSLWLQDAGLRIQIQYSGPQNSGKGLGSWGIWAVL